MSSEMSRRKFLQVAAAGGLFGFGVLAGGCGQAERQAAGGSGWIPEQYDEQGGWPAKVRGRVAIEPDNIALVRDDKKCILCGQCIEACEKVMSVHGSYPLPLKSEIPCINCGQCIMWCPTGAITERSQLSQVRAALADKRKFVVVQTAPAVKVSLGEEFGLEPSAELAGRLAAALRRLSFDAVFDTCFAADLTVLEEAAELLARLQSGAAVPQFTSCCPGWVKFCEYFFPDMLLNLSSCKSPQQMLGAVVKSYYAKQRGLAAQDIVSVAVMPCTAKKAEAARQEMQTDGLFDVDFVLTTRELAKLLRLENIDLASQPEEGYDTLLGESSGAGRIFASTGGVTEAAVRTLYYYAVGEAPPPELMSWQPVRGLTAVKEAVAAVPKLGEVRVAVCHGLKNARSLLENIRREGCRWHFIEFMACTGGCIGGGGQPKSSAAPLSDEQRLKRSAAVYASDRGAAVRLSYQNEALRHLYDEYLGAPLSERAEMLLHTSYTDKSGLIADKGRANDNGSIG